MSTPKTVNLVNNLNEKLLFVKVLESFVFKAFYKNLAVKIVFIFTLVWERFLM